jgi:uncharacterized protein YbjT (DUF2867 family)
MVLVAIAGGSSGGLGRSIIHALLSSGKHTPIILSRARPDGPSESTDPTTGVTTKYVSYTSLSSLTTALKGVHTLLSVLLVPDTQVWAQIEINLLHAARAAGVKRFAPSEWSFGPDGHAKCLPLFQPKLEWWEECKKVAAQAASEGEVFEVSRFHVGYFMNYLGYGAPFDEAGALAGHRIDDIDLFFHLKRDPVIIPEKDGGGIPRITMTELGDVGRFVAEAVGLAEGEWEEEMGVAGDTVRFDEIVGWFEEATGRKIEVRMLGRKELEETLKEREKEGDTLGMLGAQFFLCCCEDRVGLSVVEGVVNRKCPTAVMPVTVRVYLGRFWGGGR